MVTNLKGQGMEGYTLVAVITTTRDPQEYFARNRDELINSIDELKLDVGDCIRISMEYLSNDDIEYSLEVIAQKALTSPSQ